MFDAPRMDAFPKQAIRVLTLLLSARRLATLLLASATAIATPLAEAQAPLPAAEAVPSPRVVVLRVVDRLDRPVSGVSACLLPECSKAAATGTPDGLRVELPADGTQREGARLRVEAPGFLPTEVAVPAAGDGPVPVRMKAKGSVAATFLSPDEKREESVVVALTPAPAGPGERPARAVEEKKVLLAPRPKAANVTFEDVPAGTCCRSRGSECF